MPQELLRSLEETVENKKFVLIDSSSLMRFYSGLQTNFCNRIYHAKHLSEIPQTLLEETIEAYITIQHIINNSISFVTKDVFFELENIISRTEQTLKKICRTQDSSRLRSYSTKSYGLSKSKELEEEMKKTRELLKIRQVFFKQNEIYEILFSFFKYLLPSTKSESKQMRENGDRYHKYKGDESICAATLYFTITGENQIQGEEKTPTTVITLDSDIKKAIRNTYHLFMIINQKKFGKMIKKTPFVIYTTSKQEPSRYCPLVDTEHINSMGTLNRLREIMGDAQLNEQIETAYDVFNRIC